MQGGAAASVPKIQFEEYTLPNCLQVILHVDRKRLGEIIVLDNEGKLVTKK